MLEDVRGRLLSRHAVRRPQGDHGAPRVMSAARLFAKVSHAGAMARPDAKLVCGNPTRVLFDDAVGRRLWQRDRSMGGLLIGAAWSLVMVATVDCDELVSFVSTQRLQTTNEERQLSFLVRWLP